MRLHLAQWCFELKANEQNNMLTTTVPLTCSCFFGRKLKKRYENVDPIMTLDEKGFEMNESLTL